MADHHAPGAEPKKVNIHRRIVSYGLLLAIAAIAFGVVVSTRYDIKISEQKLSVIRYDRWTGHVDKMEEGQSWKSF